MSAIDIDGVAGEAAKRMVGILTGAGKDVASYAQTEAKKLATSAVEIAALRAAGQIDDEEAKLQLDIQKQAAQTVLLAIKGVSLLAAEQAINAGLQVILGAVRTATGLNLFPGA